MPMVPMSPGIGACTASARLTSRQIVGRLRSIQKGNSSFRTSPVPRAGVRGATCTWCPARGISPCPRSGVTGRTSVVVVEELGERLHLEGKPAKTGEAGRRRIATPARLVGDNHQPHQLLTPDSPARFRRTRRDGVYQGCAGLAGSGRRLSRTHSANSVMRRP